MLPLRLRPFDHVDFSRVVRIDHKINLRDRLVLRGRDAAVPAHEHGQFIVAELALAHPIGLSTHRTVDGPIGAKRFAHRHAFGDGGV